MGGGISHAIGTGGRDLKGKVGGITALQGLELLANDEETAVIVLISKPPETAVANKLLAAVIEQFEEMLRGPDKVGRLGLGELGVLLPETNLNNAAAVAERLRRAVEALKVTTEQGTRSVTVSVGVAALTPRLRDPKSFLMRGSFELRRARSYGGNRVCVASPEKVRLTVPRNAQIH